MSNKAINCVTAKQSEMIKKVKGILQAMPKDQANRLTKKAAVILRTKRAAAVLVKGLTPAQRKVFHKLAHIASTKSAAPQQKPWGPLRTTGDAIMRADDAVGQAAHTGLNYGQQGVTTLANKTQPVRQDIMRDTNRAIRDIQNIPTAIADTGRAMGTTLGNTMFTPQGMRLLDPEAQAAYGRTQREWEKQQHQEAMRPDLKDPALKREYEQFKYRAMQAGVVDPNKVNSAWAEHQSRRAREHQQYRDILSRMDPATQNQFRQFMQDRAATARAQAAEAGHGNYMDIMRTARENALQSWKQQQRATPVAGAKTRLGAPSMFTN
jgi:hypothetical protein